MTASASVPETPVSFTNESSTLLGILHPTAATATTGVLVVVGGPQYRVGSHRQFVVLARGLAEAGIPVLRFDCRGMGDSSGEFPGFESLDSDIASAIDAFFEHCPGLTRVVLWGLCDGASAAIFYAHDDARVAGLCLVNPWVRTEQGQAAAQMKYYYLQRLADREFWRKLISGKVGVFNAIGGLLASAKRAAAQGPAGDDSAPATDLPGRVFRDLGRFDGPVLLVISGDDLTAAEFMMAADSRADRRELLYDGRMEMATLPDADHTFSRSEWMDEVVDRTVNWIESSSRRY